MEAEETKDGGLAPKLAKVLPKGHTFGIYHLSTPPLQTDALCSAPPNERPDKTFCEKHFLAVTIDAPAAEKASSIQDEPAPKREVMILGLEIYIFTTAHSSILFVSKADSTGYLSLLKLPKGAPSPIREVSAAVMSHLVETRIRPKTQFVISLFARAQGQYLFPGSVENTGKHVLDDRGLIKWWCRVLNPLIESPPSVAARDGKAHGYLIVPGLDAYETKAFVPRTSLSSWSLTHPLEKISHYTREFDWVPPRCLIPRYPDDPKSRFRDELDEEAHKSGLMKNTGSWQSVKTLDMFWEMMAFRQECSSGRMTGFAWVVFNDKKDDRPKTPETPKKQQGIINITTPSTTPRKLFTSTGKALPQSTNKPKPDAKSKKKGKHREKKKIVLKGIIKTKPPRSKTEQRNYLLEKPESTPYYWWPVPGRGERIFSEDGYKRTNELLLHLDFATLDKACGSTKRWISEVGLRSAWGYKVMGTVETPVAAATETTAGVVVNNLSGLVKRKRSETDAAAAPAEPVTMLSAGLIRKKPKPESS